MKPLWIKWYPVQWLHSTCRDEMNAAERSAFQDFVCLAAVSPTPGQFKFVSEESLARMLNTSLEVVKSAMKICVEKKRTTIFDTDEGKVCRIIKWDQYQPTQDVGGINHKVENKDLKLALKQQEKRREENIREDKRREVQSSPILFNEVEVENKFNELWKAWPAKGRFDKVDCFKKFKSICKKGYYEELVAGVNGYLQMLEIKEKKENFKQNPKHLATFLNMEKARWREYIGIKYKPEN